MAQICECLVHGAIGVRASMMKRVLEQAKASCGLKGFNQLQLSYDLNSFMLLKYTIDNGQRSLMVLTAAYDGS
jgi:hypothetical protein